MEKIIKDKIDKKTAKVAVIGMGYVGLPLAVEFAKANFKVTGIDVDKKRITSIAKGISYILDIDSREVKQLVNDKFLKATDDFKALKDQDAVIICVPTPLRKTKEPDISYIISASENIAKYMKKGQLIILESTTYPGTTEEVLQPMFEKKGFKLDRDFFLAFSPERVDPANNKFNTSDITKVVGGVTKKSTELAALLYGKVIKSVMKVSSSRVAEMAKLLENTFRSVNIGLVNELAVMSEKLGIDFWEVIEAAKTKPFGFMPFYPGPGIGGHCIPLDPIYLAWKAKRYGFDAKFIELADHVNSHMPEYVVERLTKILSEKGKYLSDSKIMILGVAYKKNVIDSRESPAFEVLKILLKHGAEVYYSDPYVKALAINGDTLKSSPLTAANLKNKDCALILTDHDLFDYEFIAKNSKLVFDTRNATKNVLDKKRIIKL